MKLHRHSSLTHRVTLALGAVLAFTLVAPAPALAQQKFVTAPAA